MPKKSTVQHCRNCRHAAVPTYETPCNTCAAGDAAGPGYNKWEPKAMRKARGKAKPKVGGAMQEAPPPVDVALVLTPRDVLGISAALHMAIKACQRFGDLEEAARLKVTLAKVLLPIMSAEEAATLMAVTL